jgi:hypothetical protein
MRLPNAWVVAGLAACLGAALGGGIAVVEAALRPWAAGDVSAASRRSGPQPRVAVPETAFMFGSVGLGEKDSHEFLIRNTGEAPLELTRGTTSCSCTVSDFEASEGGSATAKVVPPGGTTKLRVTWRGKGPGGHFRQEASVLTNDPNEPRITFTVQGIVTKTFKLSPPVIALPRLTANEGHRETVKVFSFGTEAPRVESLTLTDEKTAPFFTVAWEAMEADAIAAEPAATGGFQVSVEIRPGIPLGAFQQTISAVFRTPEEVRVEIPVQGSISGDLSLAGPRWDSTRETLLLGSIPGRIGGQAALFLTAKGAHRHAVRPVVEEVVPASLQVVVGEAKPVGSGNVIRIPLEITIPPGSAPANHICSPQAPAGKIVLRTGHPDSPVLTIPVCVVVEP